MLAPSPEIIQLLSAFRAATTAPTFERMLTLLWGAVLAPGVRTVTSCLRAVGLEQVPDFGNYHRVLSRCRWSPLVMSRILLSLLVAAFLPKGAALVLVVDDTLERRRGKKVCYKGLFRDAVRSTRSQAVCSYGIRWVVVALLVQTPWSRRPWALPVLVVPSLSQACARKLQKRFYRTPIGWARLLLEKVRGWYPDRKVVLVGDGGYASIELVRDAQWEPAPATFVARMRLDAALYDAPGTPPAGKRGRKPKKGARQPRLSERAQDPHTDWREAPVRWYGKEEKRIAYATGVALWHTSGQDPVEVRWVLLRNPEEPESKPCALLCSDTDADPLAVLAWFVGRWSIEVTFEEMRACLGLGTQRHWSKRALLRTTPLLFGVFSLVTLMAHRLYPKNLPLQKASWYEKEEATFSDALAAVRAHLWTGANYKVSPLHPEHVLIPLAMFHTLKRAAQQPT